MLEQAEVADRLRRESDTHGGVEIAFRGERVRIALEELTNGKVVTIYGQNRDYPRIFTTRVTHMNGIVINEAEKRAGSRPEFG